MKKFNILGFCISVFLSLMITFSASAGRLSEGTYGYNTGTALTPLCGGKGQKDCLGTGATFEGSATSNCPAGSIFNLWTWGCYTCPPSFTLSFDGAWDPDSERACSKVLGGKAGKVMGSQLIGDIVKATETNTAPAELHGTICDEGTFYDLIRNGECWSCDSGYDRNWDLATAHIDGDYACVKGMNFSKATNHAYGTGVFKTDCPAGQFWDGYQGRCHSCDSGYDRTAEHISSAKACSKPAEGALYKPANPKKQKVACEDGQFVDPLLEPGKGGTCFSCPPTYTRTGAPVTNSDACGTNKNVEFANSTRVTDLTCAPGQKFDLINWQHKRVKDRAKGFDLDRDNKLGGTCWSCPEMSAGRSVAAVYEPDACVAPDIRWEMPEWISPGVYGRYPNNAGVDLVTELMTDRRFINSIIDALWEESKSNSLFRGLTHAEMKAGVWEEIITRPATSGVLRLALKSILVKQALGQRGDILPNSQSPQKYLAAFETAVTQYRTFLVEQSKAAFKIWDERAIERDVYKTNQSGAQVLEKALFAVAMLPWPPQSVPDFIGEAEELTLDFQTTETALKMAAIDENVGSAFKHELFPVVYVAPKDTSANQVTLAARDETQAYLEDKIQGAIQEATENGLRRVSSRVVKGGAAKVASAVLHLAKLAEGPLVVIDIVLTIQDVWGEVLIERATMLKQYDNALAIMRQPYSLRTALGKNTSTGEFDLYLNVIMDSNAKFKAITPSAAMQKEICPVGTFTMGVVTGTANTSGGIACLASCPVKGSIKQARGSGCSQHNAEQFVKAVFVAKNGRGKSCPEGSLYKYVKTPKFIGCMKCPVGYKQYSNWDESVKEASRDTECGFDTDFVPRAATPVF